MWYYIYDDETGKLVSETTIEPKSGKYKAASKRLDLSAQQWSETAKDFEDKPRIIRIAYDNFVEALTDAELSAFLTLTDKNATARVMYERLKAQRKINLSLAQAESFFNFLVNQNVITQARKVDFL